MKFRYDICIFLLELGGSDGKNRIRSANFRPDSAWFDFSSTGMRIGWNNGYLMNARLCTVL